MLLVSYHLVNPSPDSYSIVCCLELISRPRQIQRLLDIKSQRTFKLQNWLKSKCNFAKELNFTYFVELHRKGCAHSLQQACFFNDLTFSLTQSSGPGQS